MWNTRTASGKLSLLETEEIEKRRGEARMRVNGVAAAVAGLTLLLVTSLAWTVAAGPRERGDAAATQSPVTQTASFVPYREDWQIISEVLEEQETNVHLRQFDPRDLQERFRTGRHLIISYYETRYSKERVQELRSAIFENLLNPHLAKVHVLIEDDLPEAFIQSLAPEQAERLVAVRARGGQPTYAMMFAYANVILNRGAVAIIANTDIVLGPTLECVRPVTPENKIVFNQTERRLVLALSRQPSVCEKGSANEHHECLKYRGSHDAFVFAPPLSTAFIDKVDYVQNLLGAENRLIYHLREAMHYRVANPCNVVRITHHHCAKRSRNVPAARFARRGDGAYASVDPLTKFKCGDVVY